MLPSVSVVVVSQGRETLLARCLKALSQQQRVRAEVIVVTSDQAVEYLSEKGWTDRVKVVRMNDENISVARNRGIDEASGDVVAFIDDDAVAEPGWLYYLLQPFVDAGVDAASGFTIGRNGFSFQWKAETIDAAGVSHPLAVPEDRISVFTSKPERAIKTIGTNMAVRREALLALNGFDPRYRFYLDDSDLAMRLAARSAKLAIVPMARVHHAFAPSRRRSPQRVPKTLYEIGASQSVFTKTHLSPELIQSAGRDFCKAQKQRLIKLMQAGALGPEEVAFLMVTLEDGLLDGRSRKAVERGLVRAKADRFFPLVDSQKCAIFVQSGRIFGRKSLNQRAKDAVDAGELGIVIELSPTALYHCRYYDDAGFWKQRGGIWGKSLRSQSLFRLSTFQTRARAEIRQFLREFRLDGSDHGT
ncbi:glycosyltransferase family 2 protein [Donghicola sp. XS_ASV15]|uniref:glycosyltransferase family 2 protein n=1 Tax=Donghicola sp. XS_ASV15 TaxID=3241295 RepID=UPI003513D077